VPHNVIHGLKGRGLADIINISDGNQWQ